MHEDDKYYIYTAEGKINYLLRVSQQYSFLDYGWSSSVYDFIIYNIKDWNNQRVNEKKIYYKDLNIDYYKEEELKNSYFENKNKKTKEDEDKRVIEILREDYLDF